MKTKNIVLGVSLTATLLATYFAPPAEGTDVVLSKPVRGEGRPNVDSAAFQRHASSGDIAMLTIHPRELEDEDEIFSPQDWSPPKPVVIEKVVEAMAPESPQAPPLPFQVLGRYVEKEKVTVFLQYNDQNLVVQVGDVIADKYKVERLEAGILTLRYMPLDQIQTLQVGSTT